MVTDPSKVLLFIKNWIDSQSTELKSSGWFLAQTQVSWMQKDFDFKRPLYRPGVSMLPKRWFFSPELLPLSVDLVHNLNYLSPCLFFNPCHPHSTVSIYCFLIKNIILTYISIHLTHANSLANLKTVACKWSSSCTQLFAKARPLVLYSKEFQCDQKWTEKRG